MEETLQVTVDSSQAKRGIDALSDAFSKLKNATATTASATDAFFDKLSRGLRNMENSLLSFKAILLSFTSVIAVFKSITDEITKFQAFISVMTVTSGSVGRAREQFNGLMDMADRLGVSLSSLTHNYGQLSAAAISSGVSQAHLQRGFESMAIAARVLHLSSIDTRLAFYAMTQMISKGTVSMEELRRQLGEKIPGAMNIAARSVNATMKEFEEAVRKGTVDSAKFFPIFTDAIRREFIGGLSVASQALDAELNRVRNNFTKMIANFYDSGVAKSFTEVIKEINRILSDTKIADAFAEALKHISDNMRDFLKSIGPEQVRAFIDNFTSAIKYLSDLLSDLMPKLVKIAEYIGYMAAGWAILKGISLGAASGLAVSGGNPVVGVAGALGGGAAAAYGVYSIGTGLSSNRSSNQPSPKPITGLDQLKSLDQQVQAMQAKARAVPDYAKDRMTDLEAALVRSGQFKTPYTLKDVLTQGAGKKGGAADQMQAFIDQLERLAEASGEEGNKYDAMRLKVDQLARKFPEKADKARQLIDKLELRGEEFRPLLDKINDLRHRQAKDPMAVIADEIDALVKRYPKATEMIDRVKAAFDEAKKNYESTKAYEKAMKDFNKSVAQHGFDTKIYDIYHDRAYERDRIDVDRETLGMSSDKRERTLKQLELEKKMTEDIYRLRQEAMRGGYEFNEAAVRANIESYNKAIIDALKKFQDYKKSIEFGIQDAITKYRELLENEASQISSIIGNIFQNFEDALVDWVMTGELSFKKLRDTFLAEMNRMTIRKFIIRPLLGTEDSPGLLDKLIKWLFGDKWGGLFDMAGDVGKKAAETAATASMYGLAEAATSAALALRGLSVSSGGASTASGVTGLSNIFGFGLGGGSDAIFGTGIGTSDFVPGFLAAAGEMANGGIMTKFGQVDLRKYRYGGVANSPQLAIFGEGSVPEAYVPLPDGRAIPVRMEGGNKPTVHNTVHMTVVAQDAESFKRSEGQIIGRAAMTLNRASRYN